MTSQAIASIVKRLSAMTPQVITSLNIAQAEALEYTTPSTALPPLGVTVVLRCENLAHWQDRGKVQYRLASREEAPLGRKWHWNAGPWLRDDEITGWALVPKSN